MTEPKSLVIWKKAYNVTIEAYSIFASFPPEEKDSLTTQMRRAVTSILLNITEGAASKSRKMFTNHLSYAYASAKELETILLLSRDLNYIHEKKYAEFQKKVHELAGMIYTFKAGLEAAGPIRKNKMPIVAKQLKTLLTECFDNQ